MGLATQPKMSVMEVGDGKEKICGRGDIALTSMGEVNWGCERERSAGLEIWLANVCRV